MYCTGTSDHAYLAHLVRQYDTWYYSSITCTLSSFHATANLSSAALPLVCTKYSYDVVRIAPSYTCRTYYTGRQPKKRAKTLTGLSSLIIRVGIFPLNLVQYCVSVKNFRVRVADVVLAIVVLLAVLRVEQQQQQQQKQKQHQQQWYVPGKFLWLMYRVVGDTNLDSNIAIFTSLPST